MEAEKRSFMDRFTEVAAKLGNQIHLKTLRDAFATIMPLYILAGLAVLLNNVIFVKILSGSALEAANYWGSLIINGTLNISGLMIAPCIGFFLSKNRRFKNPFAAAMISLATLIIMMPGTISAVPVGAEKEVTLQGLLSYSNIGTNSMFAGIIIGLVATELFIKVSSIKKIQVNLGDAVPQAVGDSFNVLIPVIIVMSFFAVISATLFVGFHTDLVKLISTMIQTPLKNVGTSLGLMSPCVVQIPWTTPPLLSGFLATGGDWRAIIVQALIIVLGVAIYLPFMKVSEKVQMKMMEAENEAE